MVRSNVILSFTVALITLAGGGAAFAGENRGETDQQSELNAITNAKTSPSQAIAAAEQESGGKAVETGLENQDGVVAYEIDIAKATTLQRILVDADSGKVTTLMAVDDDHENGEHEDQDEEANTRGVITPVPAVPGRSCPSLQKGACG
jgi:uncharacterized membrane protein YkoI